ncbi:hypothetical protein AAK938_01195 [Aerococcaceae bacterium 50-4]
MKKIYEYYFKQESDVNKSLMKDFAWLWGTIGFLTCVLLFIFLPSNMFYGLLGGVLVLPFLTLHSIYKKLNKKR